MIPRDGNCKSLWQDTAEAYQPVNIPGSEQYDIIIVGGGITGVSTALLLQKAGKKCLLLEANSLCFGTTGGTTAHLNTLLDTTYDMISNNFGKENAKLVAQSVKEAIEFIKGNIREHRIVCGFEETDAFLFAQTKEQEKELAKIKESTIEAGVSADYTNKIPVAIAFSKAIQVKNQAKFIPTQYVQALAHAFEDAGGVIIQQCRVTGAEENEVINV